MIPEFEFEVHRFAFLSDLLRLCMAFLRCPEAQPLPRSVVEVVGDRVETGLRDMRHAPALRQVLTDQPVGVLVGASLP